MDTPATTSDAPASSRFFTVLGWICILSGLYVLATSLIGHFQIVRLLRGNKSESQLLLYNVSFAIRCGLSVLSIASGLGMWKRRSWAPWIMSLAGGATVATCVWFVAQGVHPYLRLMQEARRSMPMAALDLGFSILSKVLQLVLWLAVLGGLYRKEGRREFPASRPPFTKAALFGLASLGAMAIILVYFLVLRIASS